MSNGTSTTEQEELQNKYARLKELVNAATAAIAAAEDFANEHKLSFGLCLDGRYMQYITEQLSAPDYMDAPCWASSSDYC